PASAARLVTDSALRGQYTSTQGTRVAMPAEYLRPDIDSLNPIFSFDTDRSYASQLFQRTAINLHYARHAYNGERVRWGVNPGHNEERLVNANGQVVSNNPGIQPTDLIGISNEITGRHESTGDVLIANASSGPDGIHAIRSEAELRTRLERLRSE